MTHLFTKWTVLAVCAPGLGDGRTFDRDALLGGGGWISQAATFSLLKDEGEDDPCSPIQTQPGIPEHSSLPRRSKARCSL